MIPFQRPRLPPADAIERYFAWSREASQFSNGGPCAQTLERRLAERAGANALTVASGTAGLVVAIAAVLDPARPRPGLAVMPSFTFPAAAHAARACGLAPAYVDIDPQSWQLDADDLRHALTRWGADVRVVIAGSTFGTPPPACARASWEAACSDAGVPLILDSAAGFGAVADDGVHVGAQGAVEVVSFHATKPLAAGEGGAIFARDETTIFRAARIANFGFDAERVVVEPLATNAKLGEQAAATALAALDRLDDGLARRRAATRTLLTALGDLGYQLGSERSTWQFVPAAFADATERAAVEDALAGVAQNRRYHRPLHGFGVLGGLAGALPVTDALAERLLCLPMAEDLSADEIAAIAGAVTSARARPGRPLRPARLA